jgi:hypothetical protein
VNRWLGRFLILGVENEALAEALLHIGSFLTEAHPSDRSIEDDSPILPGTASL